MDINISGLFQKMFPLFNAVQRSVVTNDTETAKPLFNSDQFIATALNQAPGTMADHLAILSNRDSSARARQSAREALITMGGNSPAARRQIVAALTTRLRETPPTSEVTDIARVLAVITEGSYGREVITPAITALTTRLNDPNNNNDGEKIDIVGTLGPIVRGLSGDVRNQTIRGLNQALAEVINRENPPTNTNPIREYIETTLLEINLGSPDQAVRDRAVAGLTANLHHPGSDWNSTTARQLAAITLSRRIEGNISQIVRDRAVEALTDFLITNDHSGYNSYPVQALGNLAPTSSLTQRNAAATAINTHLNTRSLTGEERAAASDALSRINPS